MGGTTIDDVPKLTPTSSDAVRIGEVLLGKYRVESILGRGGMGVVAECTHIALNERIAIKMLRPDVTADRDAVERFMREAQAAVKLKSEYVARVSDVGTFEDGTPYMIMEYLEGHDLGVMIGQRGHLPVAWTAELMLQTAEGLSEAHALGIVHRDIKPTNLFVTWRPDGTALIKVLDFGISKTLMGNDLQLTQTQSLLGTPAYMSPEQMRSARLVDARTDIWSLGTVMYELIEGHRPFEAASFSEMCVKVAVDAPQPMTNAPPELEQVILRCLAKNPDQRYSSMADLGRDLIPFANDQHHALMLVERMHRMLQRSVGDFDGNPTTGVGLRAVPSQIRDAGKHPIRAQSAPLRLPAAGIPNGTSHEPSAPALAPSERFAVPHRRRRLGVILVVAALVGGLGAVAIAVVAGGRDRRPATALESPQTMPVIADPATPLEPEKPGAIVARDGSAAPAIQLEVPDKAAGAGSGRDNGQIKTTAKVRTSPSRKPSRDPRNRRDPKELVKAPKGDAAPNGECKPFDHPHGCPRPGS